MTHEAPGLKALGVLFCGHALQLNSIDELPYIMGLVRQSYERQMGDGGQE
jgi:hypothetical protein